MEKLFFVDIHDDTVQINDGGSSRVLALRDWLKKNRENTEFVVLKKSKLRIIKVILFLLKVRNSKVFFVHPEFGFDVFVDDLSRRLLTKLFFCLLRRASKRNDIIFDVNDLKYEQSIDLELTKYSQERIRQVEERLFKINARFVFAAEGMREYACEKYKLNRERTEVLVNGAYPAPKALDTNKTSTEEIVCVYAGTLNRGRNIEQMVASFPADIRYKLILMGVDGEWIKENQRENVVYLGALQEDKAREIVMECDIGLIPYDDSRFYYNIAFPVKFSFYITAGIPILTTPIDEIMDLTLRQNIGWCEKLSDWHTILQQITFDDVASKKHNVEHVKEGFTWDAIFSSSEFLK